MCTIVDVIDFENKAVEPSLLLAMNKAIVHREYLHLLPVIQVLGLIILEIS